MVTSGPGNPTVSITSPHAGDNWTGAHTLTWTASAPAGATVYSTVLYSYDGSNTWLPLTINTTDMQYNVDPTSMTGGSQVFFEVIATTGISTASAMVGPITINQTPVIGAPALVDFGTVTVGQTHDMLAPLSNTGSGVLTIQSLSTDNPAFTAVTPATPFDIVGASQRSVRVRCAGVASGTQNGNLTVQSTDSVHASVKVPLVCRASNSTVPNVQVPPSMLDFGNVGTGQTLDLPVTITNSGTASLSVTSASVTAPFLISAGGAPFTVAANSQQSITVRFAPMTLGAQMGSLSIATSDAVHPSLNVSLKGTGVTPCVYILSAMSTNVANVAASGSVNLSVNSACGWSAYSDSRWLTMTSTPAGTGNGGIGYSIAANTGSGARTGTLHIADQSYMVTQNGTINGLGFFALTPCRMVDTRSTQNKTGMFGPPGLLPYTNRNFPLLSSTCNIPGSAQVYSTNITVVPGGELDFLSAWPANQPYPNVSTLNSPDGSVIANAAFLPSGSGGAVTIAAGQKTDLIMDINGYFAPPNGSELVFYPLPPCRIVDTRGGQGKTGQYGPPSLLAYTNRNFAIANTCGVPSTAQAFSLNMTAVPTKGELDFLSTWPAGQNYPGVSTLNSPDGDVIANAAIVPSGGGSITVAAGNATDLIIDVNGYFGAAGSPGGLHFYPLTPCRVVDTRSGQGKDGTEFGPPRLSGYVNRNFNLLNSTCNIPSTAQAYSLNFTAVPAGQLDFLSTWPMGQGYPGVSTLNSTKGTVIANAVIVPAGTGGAITVVAGNPTDLIIDINGYFAP